MPDPLKVHAGAREPAPSPHASAALLLSPGPALDVDVGAHSLMHRGMRLRTRFSAARQARVPHLSSVGVFIDGEETPLALTTLAGGFDRPLTRRPFRIGNID